MPDNDKPDDPKLRAMYDQLCESYRAIDDFRTKGSPLDNLAGAT